LTSHIHRNGERRAADNGACKTTWFPGIEASSVSGDKLKEEKKKAEKLPKVIMTSRENPTSS